MKCASITLAGQTNRPKGPEMTCRCPGCISLHRVRCGCAYYLANAIFVPANYQLFHLVLLPPQHGHFYYDDAFHHRAVSPPRPRLSCLIRATGWANAPRWGGRLRCWLAAPLPLPQHCPPAASADRMLFPLCGAIKQQASKQDKVSIFRLKALVQVRALFIRGVEPALSP
jgi:hypothetical protein